MKAKWIVRLGQSEWERHARNVGETLRLLGSVQRGAQVGALAVNDKGEYFQVNGEYVAPLNRRLIAKAVSAAQSRPPSRQEQSSQRNAPAPVVTVRRSRVAALSLRPRDRSTGGD